MRASEFHYNGQTYSLRAQGAAMVMFSAFVLMVATNVSQVLMGGTHRGLPRVRRALRREGAGAAAGG